MWSSKEQNSQLHNAISRTASVLHKVAKKEGQTSDNALLYPNYATFDTPLEKLYGNNLPKLKELKRLHDLNDTMGLVGGFKFRFYREYIPLPCLHCIMHCFEWLYGCLKCREGLLRQLVLITRSSIDCNLSRSQKSWQSPLVTCKYAPDIMYCTGPPIPENLYILNILHSEKCLQFVGIMVSISNSACLPSQK